MRPLDLAFLAFLALLVLLLGLWRRMRLRAAARRQLATLKKLFGEPPQHRPASLAEFPHADKAFYEAATSVLEKAGFRQVGDTTDERLKEGSLLPVCVRRLVDGRVQAMIYHPIPRNPALRAREQRVVELDSELASGEHVATTNGLPTGFNATPGIELERLPPGTPAADVLARHRARVEARLAQTRGATLVPLTTYDESVASQVRAHAHRIRYRESIGWCTEEEILAIAGPKRRQAGLILYREIQRLVARDRA